MRRNGLLRAREKANRVRANTVGWGDVGVLVGRGRVGGRGAVRRDWSDVQLLDVVPLFLLDPLPSFCLPAFVTLNEFREVAGLLRHPDKLVLKEFSRRWSLIEAHLAWEWHARPGCGRLTSLGSRCRQQATNSRKDFENGPSRVGGGFLGIRNRTCAAHIW